MWKWGALIHFAVYVWMRLAMEGKGQALTCLFPPGPSAVGAGEHRKQLNMLLLRVAGGLLLVREVFTLVVTRQSNNLQVWAINTATTAAASISADISGVPVHEQKSTEWALTNTSTLTHTHIQIDVFKLMHWITHSHMYMHSHTGIDTCTRKQSCMAQCRCKDLKFKTS